MSWEVRSWRSSEVVVNECGVGFSPIWDEHGSHGSGDSMKVYLVLVLLLGRGTHISQVNQSFETRRQPLNLLVDAFIPIFILFHQVGLDIGRECP